MYFDEIVDPLDKGLTRNLRTVIYGSMTLVIISFSPGTLVSSAANAAKSLIGVMAKRVLTDVKKRTLVGL